MKQYFSGVARSTLVAATLTMAPSIHADPIQLDFSIDLYYIGSGLDGLFPDDLISGYLTYDSLYTADYVYSGDGYSGAVFESPSEQPIGLFIDQFGGTPLVVNYFEIYDSNTGIYFEVQDLSPATGNPGDNLYIELYSEYGTPIFSDPTGSLPTMIDQPLVAGGGVYGYLGVEVDAYGDFADGMVTELSAGGSVADYPPPVVNGEGELLLGGPGLETGARIDDGDTLETTRTVVGFESTGAFVQTGGTHTTTDELLVGGDSDNTETADGSYQLIDGTLTTDTTQVGHYGVGTFTQTGGTHEARWALFGNVGSSSPISGPRAIGIGTYSLQGGDFNPYELYIGASGQGTLNQSGGNLTVGNEFAPTSDFDYFAIGISGTSYPRDGFDIPEAEQSFGRYNLSAGTATINGSTTVGVGSSASAYVEGGLGYFNQSGGSFSTHNLVVGEGGSSVSGEGHVTVSDGTLTASGDIVVGVGSDAAPATATFAQSGGLVSANAIRVGEGGPGGTNSYRITGGQTTVSGSVDVGTAEITSGTALLEVSSGGLLSGNVNLHDGGVLMGDGGTIFGDVMLAGGTLAPGLSPGTLTITGDLLIDDGVLELEFFSPTQRDLLIVSGGVMLGESTIIDVLLGFVPTEVIAIEDFFDAGTAFDLAPGYDPATQIMFGFNDGVIVDPGTTLAYSFDGETYSYAVSAVPLPGAAWLMISAILGGIAMVKKRAA